MDYNRTYNITIEIEDWYKTTISIEPEMSEWLWDKCSEDQQMRHLKKVAESKVRIEVNTK